MFGGDDNGDGDDNDPDRSRSIATSMSINLHMMRRYILYIINQHYVDLHAVH